MSRRLYLRWLWLNTGAVMLLGFGASHYRSHLHGLALIVLAAILARGAAGSWQAGRMCWRADNTHDDWERAELRRRLDFIRAAAWECQMVAICGTALGFFDVLTGSGDVISRVQHGAGAAVLLGTFTGVLSSLVLERTLRWLEHDLGA